MVEARLLATLNTLITVVYFGAAVSLFLYGLNCYVMIYLHRRRRKSAAHESRMVLERFPDLSARDDLPVVTTQIPVFNEFNVARRVIEAACRINYPAGKHEIQVLDDSNDETRQLIDEVAAQLRAEGSEIRVIRRASRHGFKAGALAEGLDSARGELIAVFDADFVPPPDFLQRAVPFFISRPGLGLAQARWGHLNRCHSLLTRAQAIGIDGHFMVEQSARAFNALFMNFNGTAGLWRRDAIVAGGGWQWDTLTEDMDLSYRVQLAGWAAMYLPDLIVPAEIPEDISAFKSQQFRWAKGSIQTARKILPAVWRAPLPLFKKAQAFLHLTHYLVHPMMLTLAVLALPVLLTLQVRLGPALFAGFGLFLLLAMMAPSSLYIASQQAAYQDWYVRILWLPMLVVIGVGLAVSNSRGVFEALLGRSSGFVRTPKRGEHELKRYRVRLPWVVVAELLLGLYCAASLAVYLTAGKYFVGPFLALYAAGFLFIGLLSWAHNLGLGSRFLAG